MFWSALGGAVVVVGGVLTGVGVARTPARGTVWSSAWFVSGAVLVGLGGVALIWSLILHLAHGHTDYLERRASPGNAPASGGGATEWRPPVEPKALGRYLDEVNRTLVVRGFGGDVASPSVVAEPTEPTPSWESLNQLRIDHYETNFGLFLVHDWVPSDEDGQVADVTLRLCQHGDGPLTRGEIQVVEYSLGPKFTNHSLVCTSAEDDYSVSVSMYGPMLCVAKVYFRDKRPAVVLERYVNFDDHRELRHATQAQLGGSGPGAELTDRLQDLLRRGQRIRANTSLSIDGSSGPAQMWEQDVAIALEDAGKHDLLARFEKPEFGDTARGVIDGAWATRRRMDRKLQLLSDFVREQSPNPSPSASTRSG